MTFADVKAGKLSTRVETADQFVDDLVARRASSAPSAPSVPPTSSSVGIAQAERTSDGMLLFYRS